MSTVILISNVTGSQSNYPTIFCSFSYFELLDFSYLAILWLGQSVFCNAADKDRLVFIVVCDQILLQFCLVCSLILFWSYVILFCFKLHTMSSGKMQHMQKNMLCDFLTVFVFWTGSSSTSSNPSCFCSKFWAA